MAQNARFFDGVGYTEDQYAEVQNRVGPEGVYRDVGGQLAVTLPGGMFVRVSSGELQMQGFWGQNTANQDIAVGANSSGSTRTDNVVARLNRVTNTITLVVVPNAPTPTRTAGGDWEMLLATITVPNGAAAPSAVTDQREGAFCGYTGRGIGSAGTSRSAVGVSSPFDRDTGVYWAAANTLELVTGAVPALVATTTSVIVGNQASHTAVNIGRAGMTTTVMGALTVNEATNLLNGLGVSGSAVFNNAATFQTTIGVAGYASFSGANLDLSSASAAAVMRVIGAQAAYSHFQLIRPDSVVQANFILGHTGNQFLGSAGDLQIYTAGTGAGRLILGTQGVATLHMTGGLCHIGPAGLSAGVGRLNVFAKDQGANGGLNVYNGGNFAIWTSLWNDNTGRSVMSTNAAHIMWSVNSNGYTTFGTTPIDTTRLGIYQNAAAANEGMVFILAGTSFYSRYFIGSAGHANLQSLATATILRADVASFAPASDQGAHLGFTDTRWANIYALALILSGGLSATTGVFSSNVSMAALTASTGTFSGNVSCPSMSSPNASTITMICNLYPSTTASNFSLGHPTNNKWNELFCQVGYNTSGAWISLSDDAVKMKDSFRPFGRGLGDVLRMEPVYFRYSGEYGTPEGEEHIGLRAQELVEIVPEMVGSLKVKRTPRSRTEQDVMTTMPGLLVFPLINAVKELKAELDELRAMLQERKN